MSTTAPASTVSPAPLPPQPPQTSFWRPRLRASGIHLGLSLAIALLAAWLVFGLWYPYPYREISGGRELFAILVSVDVVLGPLITLAVFDRVKKPLSELRRDLAVVALLQLSALGYGLYTVYVARPVQLVFEYYRFAVVHAVDFPEDVPIQAPAGINPRPITGPGLLSLREFKDAQEKMEMTMAALGGAALPTRTELWQPYPMAAAQIRKEGKPVAELKARFPKVAPQIDQLLAKHGTAASSFLYLPMVARRSTAWTVLVDPATLEIKEFLPLDSF
jgi:hypothetical protein